MDSDNSNLPLASLMRFKDVELNNERVQSLKWSGIVLQGEGFMSGDDGDWTGLGLGELEDIARVVKKGSILLQVGQCWEDRRSVVGSVC